MILYLLRYYPTLSETFVYREIAELVRRGHPVVVGAIGQRADGALQDELPTVEVIRPPKGLIGAMPRWVRALSRPEGRTAWRWLRRHHRARVAARALWLAMEAEARGVRRVHAHFGGEAGEWARAAAQILGVPYSVTVHAVDLFRPRPGLAAVLDDARPAVTVSAFNQRWIRTHYGVDARLVRCGVDPGSYPPARPDGDGPLRVVCVARDTPKKGVDALVEAIGTLPGARLRLISDAPSLGSDRIAVGPLPPSRVPEALAAAQVFALPCRVAEDGDRDGIPVALIEAMAAGLPVISTAVSGIGELVDAQVGWLIPPDDPAALRDALLEAARSPSERARRGAAARDRVRRHWTVAQQVDGLLAGWGLP